MNLHLHMSMPSPFFFFFLVYNNLDLCKMKFKAQKNEPKNGENCTAPLYILSIYTSAAVDVTGTGVVDPCSRSSRAIRCSLANMPTIGAVLYVQASVCM